MRVFLGSVLLEPKRWSKDKTGILHLPDWTSRMLEAGFDGWDLWEFHDPPMEAAPVSDVAVYNTYLKPEQSTAEERSRLAARVRRSGARGVKFNLGAEPGAREQAVEPLRELLDACPGVDFWCECHPRTALEDPEVAIPWISAMPSRVGVILHPFQPDTKPMETWFSALPDRVRHLHLQVKGDDRRFAALSDRAEWVRERMGQLKEKGYRGDASLEFTRGVAAGADDVPDKLFAAAVDDLRFLRAIL